jgi:UDP-N-acetylmuramate--alanine ligase
MTAAEQPWRGRRLHFVGVGGAGMSGYARAAAALGATVSGSDAADSPYLARLRADGVLDAHIGHDAANVAPGDDVEVVYSSAIPAENPERAAARTRGLRERPRAELLAEFSALRRTIAVAGTHGKTTTASMLVHALRAGARDRADSVSWLVGAPIGGGLANAHWAADGELLVIEADESDRSMLSLHIDIAVLTNVELDHHATFGSLAEVRAAFAAFLARARAAIVVWERPSLLALARDAAAEGVEVVAFDVPDAARHAVSDAVADALGGGATGDAADDRAPGHQRFPWRGHDVRLRVPGAHNALDAAAALEAARLVGADLPAAIAALDDFTGAARRFQRLGAGPGGAEVYEDYAHHPTEIAATLRGARALSPQRLLAVFQPHLFSRTTRLAREFGRALALADVVVVLDVYPAREPAAEHPGVSGLLVAESAADAAHGRPVYWLPTFAAAAPVLRGLLRGGDLCLVMGAGDVDLLGRALVAGAGAGGDVARAGGVGAVVDDAAAREGWRAGRDQRGGAAGVASR